MDKKQQPIDDYEEKCDCSEDDKCGCSWPNNTTKDYNQASDHNETAGSTTPAKDCPLKK